MSFIAAKADFDRASVDDIYMPEKLKAAEEFTCNTLESGILVNDGSGRFAFHPLPRIARIAPAFGVALADGNADGHADLYLAQNFYTPQLETGRNRANRRGASRWRLPFAESRGAVFRIG